MASKRTREKASTAPVEIVRSFAFKLNCANHGGAQYESMDFFASHKATCMPEQADKTSAALFAFCRKEVLAAVNEHIVMLRDGTWKQQLDTHLVAKTNAAEYERRTAAKNEPRNHALAGGY